MWLLNQAKGLSKVNIEEERKAFEKALIVASSEECAISFIRGDTRVSIAVNIVEALFEMWLAAKAHAAETAKTKVSLILSPKTKVILSDYRATGLFYVEWYDDHGNYHRDNFPLARNREHAIILANEAGYQVVEE